MPDFISAEAKDLLVSGQPLSAAQWIALIPFLASVGLAFLVEERSVGGADRDAIFDRAEQLFAQNESNLAAHLAEYRAAEGAE